MRYTFDLGLRQASLLPVDEPLSPETDFDLVPKLFLFFFSEPHPPRHPVR